MDDRSLVRQVLVDPERAGALSARQWDLLIRQSRRANLLARLAFVLEQNGLIEQVPSAPRLHLLGAKQVAKRQAIAVRWEVDCIHRALHGVAVPVTLLKGAAYLMAGLPASDGRLFTDVDVLVPKAALAEVEGALMLAGWQSQKTTDYDQRYYRKWMHEIPPMMHITRGTTIDVHHTILPDTARIKINTAALFEGLQPLLNTPGMMVLGPTDMLLHSATHLFHEGEFEHGLRDLFDLDRLIRHGEQTPGFWSGLLPRAQVLGLTRPLHYALRYTSMWLQTPVPQEVLAAVGAAAALPAWQQALMDACFSRVLRPLHPSCDEWGSSLARGALYIRSHWMRMPLHLLIYHLARKAIVRPKPPESPSTPAGEAKQAPTANPH